MSEHTAGLLDHLTQATHISEGMGIPFDEALNLVGEAYEWNLARAARDHEMAMSAPITTIGNVTYGVDFKNKRPKEATRGTL